MKNEDFRHSGCDELSTWGKGLGHRTHQELENLSRERETHDERDREADDCEDDAATELVQMLQKRHFFRRPIVVRRGERGGLGH